MVGPYEQECRREPGVRDTGGSEKVVISYSELQQMRSLPTHLKLRKTERRIQEWSDANNGDVSVSFSGGLDSTLVAYIVRNVLGDNIPLVFSNTGVEYQSIVDFVKTHDNVEIVRPEHSFKWVLDNYGYPVVSKRVSRFIEDCQRNKYSGANNHDTVNLRMTGLNRNGQYCPSMKIPEKWKYLIDAPFKISDRCCEVIKKNPLDKYAKESGLSIITGEIAEESKMREKTYLKTGCNNFGPKKKSMPLGFWTHQDVLSCIVAFDIPYCKIYGDIIYNPTTKLLETTGEQRTGCKYCGFGCHMEKQPNRYQRMAKIEPDSYDICINKFGFGKVLDHMYILY